MAASSSRPTSGSSNAQNPGSRHTVFLSHSRKDKDFVGILKEELKMRCYEPLLGAEFLLHGSMEYDVPWSAKTCKLGLIVLSDEFFSRTKNPMLELATLVKHGIPLLPLFFKLTVGDVENQERRKSWMDKWRQWSTTDTRINISNWETALNELTNTSGLEYHLSNYEYASLVADVVCRILPPCICPCDEHVQGKERISQEVKDMFANAPEVGGAKVLALWGMEGVGKSTLCKTLCKFYHAEFAGRVCYVEFARQQNNGRNQNSLQLENIKTVCLQLAGAELHFAETHIRNVGEGIAYLENKLPSSEKFLLILDNVHEYSLDEARKLILHRKAYPRGSHLLFLGRSYNSLARLLPAIDNVCMIHKFPRLHFEEAERIFLNQTLFLNQKESDIQQHQKDFNAQPKMQAIFKQCINLCTVSRAGCDSYNPKMLESLASYLPGCNTQQYLRKWKIIISKLEKDRNDAMKPMFRLLQESYDALNFYEKDLFLDLALYTLAGKDVKKLFFELGEAHVNKCLQNLIGISFLLEDYGVQDVHRDFARDLVNRSGELFYVQGEKFGNLLSLRSRLFEKELLRNERGLQKLAFVKCTFMLEGDCLDLSDERHIRVLLLDSVEGVASLNLGSNRLRRMEIKSTCALQVEVNSTRSLTVCTHQVSQYSGLPLIDFGELEILKLQGNDKTPWKVDAAGLGACDSLKYVELDNIKLTNSNVLELSCWPCLEELKLSNLAQATMLSGLQNLTALRKLSIIACNQLSELQLPGSLSYWCIKKCQVLIKIEVVGVLPSTDDAVESSGAENYFFVCDCPNLKVFVPEEVRDLLDLRQEICSPLTVSKKKFKWFPSWTHVAPSKLRKTLSRRIE